MGPHFIHSVVLNLHWYEELHQPRLWFITGGYLVKRWFIPAAARARGQSNDLNREILASNLFNCHKEVINAPPVPSISRCIHIVYRHKKIWEYQRSNFIYNYMSTFLHYVHCKDALLDCSGERCESLTWVDEIQVYLFMPSTSLPWATRNCQGATCYSFPGCLKGNLKMSKFCIFPHIFGLILVQGHIH